MSGISHVYCSGAIKKRSGYSGCGAVVHLANPQDFTIELINPIGTGTLEEAEYCSVIMSMKEVHERKNVDKLVIHTDSELVANQVNGKQECKTRYLEPYLNLIRRLLQPGWAVEWIPPVQNSVARRFANKALRTDVVFRNMTPRKYLDACIEALDKMERTKPE